MLKKFYKFSYVTGMILIILSMMLSLKSTDPALAAGNPGTLWTTTVACGLDPVDANHFAIGDNIYLHLRGFEPNSTLDWSITGRPGGGSCDPGIAVAGGSVTFDANGDACFLAYTVLPDDCGEYQVKVGTKGDNYQVDEAAPPVQLSLGVAKSPDPSAVPYDGGNVTFTITITNTGNRDLTIDGVGDSVFSNLGTCPALIGTVLAPGASASCSFTGFVSGNPGSTHTNTFTVDADWENQTVSASGSANVAIGTLPPLAGSVQKTANPVSIEPGGSVTFSVLVSNDSTEAITLDSLTDNVFGDITTTGHDGITATTCATGGTINPAGSYSCSFTATVNGTVGGPDHVDTVSAGVSMTNGQSTTWQDSATVTFVEGPALSLNVTKVPSVASLVEPGGFVTFDFTIENTSNVLVNLDSLVDSVFGDLDGNALGDCVLPATLAVGEIYSCSITADITGTAGDTHTNTVTGTISLNDLTAQDTATVNIPITARAVPTISVVKSANPTSMDAPGGPVTYTIDITNTSATISVRIDSISDNRFGDLLANLPENGTCPSLAGVELAPAGSTSCSFTRNLVGSGGTTHVNTVTVTVHDVDLVTNTAIGTDDETVTFVPLPTISVIKSADVVSVSELGGNVNYTITVYNEVNEELTLTSLVDNVFGDLDNQGDCSIPQTLPPLGNYTCTFPATISGEAFTNHVNEVTATAEDADKNQTYDTDTETVTFTDNLPTISVVKTALEPTIDEPGGYVNFMVQVTNTNGEPVTLTSLIDDQFGSLAGVGTCAVGVLINPGATYSCQFSGLVEGNAGDVHTNVVEATAIDNEENPATANDSADVTITNVPTVIEVTKSASPTQVTEPGGNVTFTVQVNNLTVGDVTLTSLTDDIFGDITTSGHDGITATDCATGGLIAGNGGSYSCQFTAFVGGDAGFLHIDTVTAVAVDNFGSYTDFDSANVEVVNAAPEIQVIKTADPTSVPAPNATVSYTIEVVNNSIEAVTLDSLLDDQFGNLFGQGDCASGAVIQPGESYTCTFDHEISGQSGDTHTNVVTATASDNEGNPAVDTDDAVVTFTDPPQLVLMDPCSVGCDLPNVVGQICNNDPNVAYIGTVEWDAYVDNTRIGGGSLSGVPAGSCVDLSSPRQGNGLYSITVTLVDENNRTLETSCGPISCQVPGPTPTPVPPVTPPTGTPGVFIPVTGFDFSMGGFISMFQNLGLALVSVGLVMHGLSLNENSKKKSKG